MKNLIFIFIFNNQQGKHLYISKILFILNVYSFN
jgi:hypothetical protein